MKVYQDLSLEGNQEDLDELLVAVEQSLSDGWTRNTERERGLERNAGTRAYCFECDRKGDRDEGSLYLLSSDPGSMTVGNIIPSKKKRRLCYEDYNRILQDFHSRFLLPLAERYRVQVTLTDDDIGITDCMSKEVAEKLQRFSACANKATGSAHPCDRERWFDFLVSIHAAGSELDSGFLERWLCEEEGWGEEEAWSLAIEYETARDLLEFYDQHRRS